MSDFEQHPIGTVERLNRKIENLEHNLKVEEDARDRFYQEIKDQDVVIARQQVLLTQAKANFDEIANGIDALPDPYDPTPDDEGEPPVTIQERKDMLLGEGR